MFYSWLQAPYPEVKRNCQVHTGKGAKQELALYCYSATSQRELFHLHLSSHSDLYLSAPPLGDIFLQCCFLGTTCSQHTWHSPVRNSLFLLPSLSVLQHGWMVGASGAFWLFWGPWLIPGCVCFPVWDWCCRQHRDPHPGASISLNADWASVSPSSLKSPAWAQSAFWSMNLQTFGLCFL